MSDQDEDLVAHRLAEILYEKRITDDPRDTFIHEAAVLLSAVLQLRCASCPLTKDN